MDTKQKALKFIDSQKHMVIATSGPEGQAEAALVGFVHKSDFTLMFGTYNISRKYANILHNSSVAVVFGQDEGLSVQYEGVVSLLEGDELAQYKKIYFAKHPTARKYEHDAPQVYMKIAPKWVRWVDTTKEIEEIAEVSF
ncbi:MAG: pyridoxamine 5'-phosphate oxidase family protein [Candidatus Roizmanbacteria bacterium]|nr:pyridoxamine 5'-phosphate oxidase family protein [Candidatus Roizmanbacteria bacterium]